MRNHLWQSHTITANINMCKWSIKTTVLQEMQSMKSNSHKIIMLEAICILCKNIHMAKDQSTLIHDFMGAAFF